MTTFPRPVGQLADAFSGATPLAAVKAELVSHTSVNYQDVLFGSIPGSLGEVSALLLLVGAVYLLWRKVITWHIPVAVLGTWPCSSFWSASDRVCTVKRCGSSRCSICLQAEPFWVPFTWLPTIRLRR